MSESDHSVEIKVDNEHSLKKLAWAIEASQGQFKLILAYCKYINLREYLLERLKALCSVKIRTLVLKESDQTLYATIRKELGEEQPDALMVLNLESVQKLDQMMTSADQVREEFRKNFHFPLVLWVNDLVLKKLSLLAPNFENWTTTVRFTIATDKLIRSLKQGADSVFEIILNSDRDNTWRRSTFCFEIGSFSSQEIELACQDLESRVKVLEPFLEASLEFLRGQNAYCQNKTEIALSHYQQSLTFWQLGNYEEHQGVLLFCIGLCYFQQAEQYRGRYPAEKRRYWENANRYFQECIDIFEQANRLDLVAKFINQQCETLKYLDSWDRLKSLANKSIVLQQANRNPIQLAQAHGFLAELARKKSIFLKSNHWEEVKQHTQKALNILAKEAEKQLPDQSLYLLMLAESERHLGQEQSATNHLEKARKNGPLDNPELYLRILTELRTLYFKQKQYLDAFQAKQEQRSIEQRYGLRAFIGAGQLQPNRQQVKSLLAEDNNQETVASQLIASGRLLDVNRLIEHIGRNDYKLIVIHGYSGVGKSSLINGGLIPALKQKVIGIWHIIPVLIKVYIDYLEEIGRLLTIVLANEGIHVSTPLNSEVAILSELEKFESLHLRPVFIFDQFEEFFIVQPDPIQRRKFFEFLGKCINILPVKVILSLRQDYLHYLLECNQMSSMAIINNDILSKDILYKLGNIPVSDARNVIQKLTEDSNFKLELALIDILVEDLAEELGEVRPIELQIVGAQLQTENITTLAQYKKQGSKNKLIEEYLAEVIEDCGPENKQIAELFLYSLTSEKGTRPLKTRNDLELPMKTFLTDEMDSSLVTNKLDFLLKIFVESGIVIEVPGTSIKLYQLVHDYLAVFIRKQYPLDIENLTTKLNQKIKIEEEVVEQNTQLKLEIKKTKQELEETKYRLENQVLDNIRIRLPATIFRIVISSSILIFGLIFFWYLLTTFWVLLSEFGGEVVFIHLSAIAPFTLTIVVILGFFYDLLYVQLLGKNRFRITKNRFRIFSKKILFVILILQIITLYWFFWGGPYLPRIKSKVEFQNTNETLIYIGENLIRKGKVEAGLVLFAEAQRRDSSINAWDKATRALIGEGEKLIRVGKVKEALILYTEAQKLESEVKISASDWNTICWFGSLHNHAENVMFACNKVVESNPENGYYRDSRGLARWRIGNIEGAIEDFEAFVYWEPPVSYCYIDIMGFVLWGREPSCKDQKQLREKWIKALQTGNRTIDEGEIRSQSKLK